MMDDHDFKLVVVGPEGRKERGSFHLQGFFNIFFNINSLEFEV